MRLLSKLSPAEALLLLKGNNATLKELMKLTFIDLSLKRVLSTKKGAASGIYVSKGEKYHSYNSSQHEQIFLKVFLNPSITEMLFRHIVHIGYYYAKSLKDFRRVLFKNRDFSSNFKNLFFHRFSGLFAFSSQGLKLREELIQEVIALENSFTLGNAKTIIETIGGNVCLINNFDLSLLRQFDILLDEEIKRQQAEDIHSGCHTGCTWDSPGSHPSGCGNGSFDNGDSGCSGCSSSGCSGCSSSGSD